MVDCFRIKPNPSPSWPLVRNSLKRMMSKNFVPFKRSASMATEVAADSLGEKQKGYVVWSESVVGRTSRVSF